MCIKGSNQTMKVENFWPRKDFCLALTDGNTLIELYKSLDYDYSEISGRYICIYVDLGKPSKCSICYNL